MICQTLQTFLVTVPALLDLSHDLPIKVLPKTPNRRNLYQKKARQSQAVTPESDIDAMDASDDAGEDEIIEMEEDEDGIWDEDDEDDEDEEDVEVKGKVTTASATRSAPGM